MVPLRRSDWFTQMILDETRTTSTLRLVLIAAVVMLAITSPPTALSPQRTDKKALPRTGGP
ncbi:hypothetical protein NQK81_27190 [Amycolatopsis roodepoortensis]|uniref:hypothetical protein n=1 Tax=Amycolatopsis roodepoortensis TaxID=700274 RepID=UPI00214AFE79|nr:hypothetical protein [Amycolatopsis roodepoortensis]UUV28476.1 hypothetical protein NQK81_27190 [Amycolatopsis roodepoortensis]